MPRQISIPTTLSAGEFSGITDERARVKEMFRNPDINPQWPRGGAANPLNLRPLSAA